MSCNCKNVEKGRGFEIVSDSMRKHKDIDIKLPIRGTSKSAGYDICTPVDIVIPPYGETKAIATDIKACMREDEVLKLYVRSSIGFKKGLMLMNTVGIIDSDYYNNSDNEGNIHFKLKNLTDKEVIISKGERVVQGIFQKFLVADNDNFLSDNRVGGIGSTNTI